MKINYYVVPMVKRFPLAISRGIHSNSKNLFVKIEEDGIVGWGEAAPGISEGASSVEHIQSQLEEFVESGIGGFSISTLYNRAREMNISPCAYTAIDSALWDLKAKKAGMPLYMLLGLPKPSISTSVTIGINSPEIIKERVPLLMEGNSIKSLKIKLGSPEGLVADMAMFDQVIKSTNKYKVQLRVDANGGWDVPNAIRMMKWLSEKKVDYIEQPLKEGDEKDLKFLYKNRPLPIYVDESCRFSENIFSYHNYVDGVNIKLMKCGGITGALKIMAVAKSLNLKTMIGCMSESSVSIATAAAISGGINHIDLDSHYNLNPDPSEGVKMINGITTPNYKPGHGAILKKKYYA
jgi:L-alanine-DL-glutamate epimerase-like enolase superfamily enzyme